MLYYVTTLKDMGLSWRAPELVEAPSAKAAAIELLGERGHYEAKVWRADGTGDVKHYVDRGYRESDY